MSEKPWLLKVDGRWIEVSDVDLRLGIEIAASDLERTSLNVESAINFLLTQKRLRTNPKEQA